MASRPPTLRSFYRSLPPPEMEPVPEIPPMDLATIAVVESVMEPAPVDASVVADLPVTVTEQELMSELATTSATPPKLEIISLERVDRSNLPAHVPPSWRYSISRWAYRWWLWTREAFRHCFPTSKQR